MTVETNVCNIYLKEAYNLIFVRHVYERQSQ